MGGCCSSSRKLQLDHGTPMYYYYPSAPDGLLVNLNLDMSIPDTYQPPPMPMPYDVVLGRSIRPGDMTVSVTDLGKRSCMDLKEASCRSRKMAFLPPSPRKAEVELLKSSPVTASATDEEEDVCPTCLEEYDSENPKIMTKCNHHFHLSCILEWMERSDTCPVCNQEMIYEIPQSHDHKFHS